MSIFKIYTKLGERERERGERERALLVVDGSP